jgi:pyruvate-formate lyase-activating enzyme
VNKVKIYTPFTTSFQDYPDNESLSVVVYFIGCSHFCENCQNPQFQDYNFKDEHVKVYDIKEFTKNIILFTKRNKTNKVCLEGGDPLAEKNIEFTKEFLIKVKDKLDVCVYTGYSIDYVRENKIEGFKFIKTDTYMKNLSQISEKTDEYLQLASQNQKIYDSSQKLLTTLGRFYFKKDK